MRNSTYHSVTEAVAKREGYILGHAKDRQLFGSNSHASTLGTPTSAECVVHIGTNVN